MNPVMSTHADVSVVIPAYNAAAFVCEALDSIAVQTVLPREVIVVDDGSKDSTADVVRAWAAANDTAFRIDLFRQPNRGISSARNAALRHCRGNWVALLDADDIWRPQHLCRLLAAVDAIPSAIVAYGAGNLFAGDEINEQLYDDFWDKPSKAFGMPVEGSVFLALDRRALPRLLRGNFVKPSSLMVSRRAIERFGAFDEQLGTAEDREFLSRLLIQGTFVYCPESITLYRWHDDNASQARNARRNQEFGLLAVQSIVDQFRDRLTEQESIAANGITRDALAMYADTCSHHGLGGLQRCCRFVGRHFGWRFACVHITPRRVVRSALCSFRDLMSEVRVN